ncbi:MAG: T9SS type A sorting domain-containing protein, partial [Rudanella sp.]|nr:T9SS type A sorting domain-containing protein [Rudanella sp.]
PNFTVPSWQINGTAFTLQARQSGTQAPDYQYTTACGGTPPPPPPTGGALVLTTPNLNCPSGNLTLNTTGGNGSTIEYQISGLQGWTTNNVMNIPTWQRNGTAFTIQARQSGVEANSLVFTSGCANYRLASVNKTEPEQTLMVMPNPTTGRVTVRFRLAAGQAASLRTTNSQGVEVSRRAIIGTGQEQEETLNLEREVPGIYLLNLQSGSKRQTGKVVLQR